jgi:hypothetical protein
MRQWEPRRSAEREQMRRTRDRERLEMRMTLLAPPSSWVNLGRNPPLPRKDTDGLNRRTHSRPTARHTGL